MKMIRFRGMMGRQKKIKLHTILSIFISLILLIIIPGLGKLSLSLFKTRTIESFANSRQDTLLQISESVSDYCRKIELLSDAYSKITYITEQANNPSKGVNNSEFRANIDKIKKEIDESFFFPELKYDLQIICTNGFSYSSNMVYLSALLELPGTIWFYKAMKNQIDSLWQSNILFRDKDKKTNVISLVTFIKNNDSENTGAILINLDERELHRIYSQIIGFQSIIYLVDKNGQIASHPTLSMVGRFFYDMNIFNAFFDEKDWAQIMKSEREYLFSRFSSDDNPWIVVEEIPLDIIANPLIEITEIINFLMVLLLILSIIIAIFFSRKVSLPFEKLANTMEKAGQGDFSARFEKTGVAESYQMAENSQKFIDRIQFLIEEIKVIQQQKQNSELEFLQMQINPHFIYNTLFSIRCMVDIGFPEKASEMLNRFSNMLQKVLRIKSPMISILDNIEYLEDYSFILSQRFGSLSLNYEVEKGIENEKILKFILQPIVENSVFHGFADGFKEGSFITISFSSINSEYLEIVIKDNGCGMSEEVRNSILTPGDSLNGSHIGLLNVKTKLDLYYEGAASLRINSILGEGTDIHIIVPRRCEENENTNC